MTPSSPHTGDWISDVQCFWCTIKTHAYIHTEPLQVRTTVKLFTYYRYTEDTGSGHVCRGHSELDISEDLAHTFHLVHMCGRHKHSVDGSTVLKLSKYAHKWVIVVV